MTDCPNCQFNYFCCKLRVKTTFLERLKIFLSGKRNFIEKDPEGKKLLKFKNNQCLFLEKNRCSIHPVRPKPCRDFPFNQSCSENHRNIVKLRRNKF